jgi:hypothetical protein
VNVHALLAAGANANGHREILAYTSLPGRTARMAGLLTGLSRPGSVRLSGPAPRGWARPDRANSIPPGCAHVVMSQNFGRTYPQVGSPHG